MSGSVVSNSLWLHGILQARILECECVSIPYSRGSSQPRDWTWVSHTAGRFFTSWATREATSVTIFHLQIWISVDQCLLPSIETLPLSGRNVWWGDTAQRTEIKDKTYSDDCPQLSQPRAENSSRAPAFLQAGSRMARAFRGKRPGCLQQAVLRSLSLKGNSHGSPLFLLRAMCEKVGTSAFEGRLGAVQHTQASDQITVLNNLKNLNEV